MPRSPRISSGARRDELLRVATRLFGQRGFHGTSIADIAEETGIPKASLYHWVESKEDLLYQVLSGVLDSLVAQARDIGSDDSLDVATKLRRLVALHANYTVDHPDVIAVFLSESKWLSGPRGRQVRDVRREYNRLYQDVLYRARERGEIIVPADVIPIYVNFLFAMTNQLPQWYRREGFYSPSEIADLISGLVLANILPDHEWAGPGRGP